MIKLKLNREKIDINYVIDGDTLKLNPILSCEKGKLKEKYNIDLEEIRVKKYGSR